MAQYYDLFINGKVGTMQDIGVESSVANEKIMNKTLTWIRQLVTAFQKGVHPSKLSSTDPLFDLKEKTPYNINGKSFRIIPSKQADVKLDHAIAVSKGEAAKEDTEVYNGPMIGIMERLPNGGVEYIGRSRAENENHIRRKLTDLGVSDVRKLEYDKDYNVYETEEDEETNEITVSEEPIRTFFLFRADTVTEFDRKKMELRNHIRKNAFDEEAFKAKERERQSALRAQRRSDAQNGIADAGITKTLKAIGDSVRDTKDLLVRNGIFSSNRLRIMTSTEGSGINHFNLALITLKNGGAPKLIATYNHNIIFYKSSDDKVFYTKDYPDTEIFNVIKAQLDAKPMPE